MVTAGMSMQMIQDYVVISCHLVHSGYLMAMYADVLCGNWL